MGIEGGEVRLAKQYISILSEVVVYIYLDTIKCLAFYFLSDSFHVISSFVWMSRET